MTDEEMAEEYADRTVTKDWEGFDITREVRKQAFLAGLKAGRPQWHKVADGDLPKGESDEEKVYAIFKDRHYYIVDRAAVKNYEDLIAWTELPILKRT